MSDDDVDGVDDGDDDDDDDTYINCERKKGNYFISLLIVYFASKLFVCLFQDEETESNENTDTIPDREQSKGDKKVVSCIAGATIILT